MFAGGRLKLGENDKCIAGFREPPFADMIPTRCSLRELLEPTQLMASNPLQMLPLGSRHPTEDTNSQNDEQSGTRQYIVHASRLSISRWAWDIVLDALGLGRDITAALRGRLRNTIYYVII